MRKIVDELCTVRWNVCWQSVECEGHGKVCGELGASFKTVGRVGHGVAKRVSSGAHVRGTRLRMLGQGTGTWRATCGKMSRPAYPCGVPSGGTRWLYPREVPGGSTRPEYPSSSALCPAEVPGMCTQRKYPARIPGRCTRARQPRCWGGVWCCGGLSVATPVPRGLPGAAYPSPWVAVPAEPVVTPSPMTCQGRPTPVHVWPCLQCPPSPSRGGPLPTAWSLSPAQGRRYGWSAGMLPRPVVTTLGRARSPLQPRT